MRKEREFACQKLTQVNETAHADSLDDLRGKARAIKDLARET